MERNVERLKGNLRRRGGKSNALLSYSHKGAWANGTTLVMETYGDMERKDRETMAETLYRRVKERKLSDMRGRMPEDRQGVEFTHNGRTYVAFVRRLTPLECGRLQTVPDSYDWSGVSETQRMRMLGNGWTVEVIRHCFSFLPDFGRPLRVWSLFDGMSCGHVALDLLGVPLECYVSSEVDRHAIEAERRNFPDMVQVGSVTDIDVAELVGKYGVPDLLIGGSPCQSFSMSGKRNGMSTVEGEEVYTLGRYLQLKAEGFAFEGQSFLFWEYMRILTELRTFNPGILFFLENVEMQEKWERCLSHTVGVRGVHINSALVSAQQRRRIYWSNIRTRRISDTRLFPEDDEDDPFAWPMVETDIPQPEDRGLVIQDILEDSAESRFYISDDRLRGLIETTDWRKLSDLLAEPTVSVREAMAYMDTDGEFSALTEDERREIAELGYKTEKRKLKEESYGEGEGLFA